MAKVDSNFNLCISCGMKNPAANKFCSRCGTPMQKTAVPQEEGVKCASCGYLNPRDEKFCIQCSSAITQEIIVTDEGDIAVVKVKMKKIDFENHKNLVPILNKITKNKIVLDLADVEYIDSTGIGTLVTQAYRSTRTNQETKIINLHPRVMEAIRALQVDNVLDICATMTEARVSWGLPLV